VASRRAKPHCRNGRLALTVPPRISGRGGPCFGQSTFQETRPWPARRSPS
jgi:hypothetical protein